MSLLRVFCGELRDAPRTPLPCSLDEARPPRDRPTVTGRFRTPVLVSKLPTDSAREQLSLQESRRIQAPPTKLFTPCSIIFPTPWLITASVIFSLCLSPKSAAFWARISDESITVKNPLPNPSPFIAVTAPDATAGPIATGELATMVIKPATTPQKVLASTSGPVDLLFSCPIASLAAQSVDMLPICRIVTPMGLDGTRLTRKHGRADSNRHAMPVNGMICRFAK